jgi:hypothetical protein
MPKRKVAPDTYVEWERGIQALGLVPDQWHRVLEVKELSSEMTVLYEGPYEVIANQVYRARLEYWQVEMTGRRP